MAAQDALPRPLPGGGGLLSPCFALALLLVLPTMASAAWTHPGSVPREITLPKADAKAYVFLEGETADEGKADHLKDPSQKTATLFCDKRTPDDKYWAAKVAYDGCRAATRGAAVDLPPHRFTWNNIDAHLHEGVYDVYVRSYIAPGGSDFYTLSTSEGKVPSLEKIENKKGNISWFRLGSVSIKPSTKSLTLAVSTRKSQVQLDTVLLVAADHVDQSASLERVPGKESWASDKSVIFSANSAALIYKPANRARISQVSYSLQDETGAYLQRNVTLQASQGDPSKWTIKLPAPGYYNVTIESRSPRGATSTSHLIAAVIGPPLDESLRMKSRFGVWTVHAKANLAVLAGSRWNRAMRSFRDLTKAQAQAIDGKKRAGNVTFAHDLEQIGVFSFGLPNWLMDIPKGQKQPSFGNLFYPPTAPPGGWDMLANVISAYAQAHPLPDLVEMYNEPLAHWHGTDAQLVQYAHAVRVGLKRVDPNFKVLGPCMYSIRINDLKSLISAGLLKELDAISMHAYVNGTPPENEFFTNIKALKALLAKSGKADWPIYLTEFGWTRAAGTWQTPVDTLTQAQYCARSLLLGMSQDIKSLIYFCLTFRTHNKGEAGFSLVAPDGTVSPAYVTYATLAKTFAGAKPLGVWSLAPDTWLVLAHRDSDVLAAIWNTQGTSTVTVPWSIKAAIDMTGRPVTVNADRTLTATQSPTYLTLDAPDLLNIRTDATPTDILASSDANAKLKGLMVHLTSGSTPGTYTLFKHDRGGRGGQGGWVAHAVELQQPIQIVKTQMRWPADKANPELAAVIRSNVKDKPIAVRVELASTHKSAQLNIPPRSMRTTVFELPLSQFKPGVRAKADVTAQTSYQGETVKLHEQTAFTPVFAQHASDVQAASWPGDATPIDFTDWAPFPAAFVPNAAPSDCRARMAAAYGPAGLRLRVWVTDDEYQAPEPGESPAKLWTKDSIQLGLDMDAGKPWNAAVIGQGIGGHRVFEFSVRADASAPDAGVAYRERSHTEGLPAHAIAKDVRARVTHKGDTVIYDVFFPWKTLAVKTTPKAGEAIGLAVAVNDYDPKAHAKRHGLRLFKGIVQTKDPKLFGKLWLR